ncbi:MAG: methionine adenosyltransferase [Bacilli bacterium]|nr:methionine adenosyltransferase [Bacilli bacterium]
MKKIFTSEVVLSGHPDKMCDLIADHILDAYLSEDKDSRVACEVIASNRKVVIMGEITSKAKIDVEKIARQVIIDIGYDNDELGFNGSNIPILIDLNKQSPDIALGLKDSNLGAGDQGIMYGYATNETENYMPLVHNLACSLAQKLELARKNRVISGLRPDGKVQITLSYENDKISAEAIIVSIQHEESKVPDILRSEITEQVIKKVIPTSMLTPDTKIFINPTGRFVIGGPAGDSGLTGRKICVDTYGGLAHHGGGAFSGKDYTKVDRSAAYYARYVAKNIVASKLADVCEVSIAYAIGIANPVQVTIDTFGTAKVNEEELLAVVKEVFDFTPQNIIAELHLKEVSYKDITVFSHFGKNNLPWEQLDKVELLQAKFAEKE